MLLNTECHGQGSWCRQRKEGGNEPLAAPRDNSGLLSKLNIQKETRQHSTESSNSNNAQSTLTDQYIMSDPKTEQEQVLKYTRLTGQCRASESNHAAQENRWI